MIDFELASEGLFNDRASELVSRDLASAEMRPEGRLNTPLSLLWSAVLDRALKDESLPLVVPLVRKVRVR